MADPRRRRRSGPPPSRPDAPGAAASREVAPPEPESAAQIGWLHDLMYELRVEQVMTRQVVTASPADSLRTVKERLRSRGFSGVPVVQDGRVVGLVSVADVIEALEAQALDRRVDERMTRKVVTVRPEELVVEAIKKFARYRFGRLPVVDRAGSLVGILTPSDINGRLLLALEPHTGVERTPESDVGYTLGDLVSDDTQLVLRYYVRPQDMERAGEASTRVKRALTSLGVPPPVVRRAAIASYEAEMNLAIHSAGGWLTVEVTPLRITLTAHDRGPGIAEVDRALEPGFSTAPDWIRELGFGAGMGLNNIQRSADEFQLDSEVGLGTTVRAVVNLEVST